MNRKDLYTLISNVCGIDPEEINPHADFFEDLNCQGSDMIELKLQLEDLLQESIDEEEFSKVETVDDLTAYLEDLTGEIIT